MNSMGRNVLRLRLAADGLDVRVLALFGSVLLRHEDMRGEHRAGGVCELRRLGERGGQPAMRVCVRTISDGWQRSGRRDAPVCRMARTNSTCLHRIPSAKPWARSVSSGSVKVAPGVAASATVYECKGAGPTATAGEEVHAVVPAERHRQAAVRPVKEDAGARGRARHLLERPRDAAVHAEHQLDGAAGLRVRGDVRDGERVRAERVQAGRAEDAQEDVLAGCPGEPARRGDGELDHVGVGELRERRGKAEGACVQCAPDLDEPGGAVDGECGPEIVPGEL